MRKLKHLTTQFADESIEYTMKGRSIQYELLECAIKGKCNMNSEYSDSESIKLSKSLYTILYHLIIINILEISPSNYPRTLRSVVKREKGTFVKIIAERTLTQFVRKHS